jgi:hypothetical protein
MIHLISEEESERILRRREKAWRNLVKGKRYSYPERGWTGRFDGHPSDSFTAWMTFDQCGQCGVDPCKLVPEARA